ncbi:MAG: glycosyltransferase family 4 protein [Gemmataceae bacterium]
MPAPYHIAVLDEELAYPLNSGKRIRTWNLLSRCAERHRVTVLCHRNADAIEAEEAAKAYRAAGMEVIVVPRAVPKKEGAAFYARLAGNLLSSLPYTVETHSSPALARAVLDLFENDPPDVWHVEWTPYAQVLKEGLGDRLARVPWVVTAHNVETQIWTRYAENESNPLKRWYVRKQESKFATFERWAFAAATRSIAVSELDAAVLRDRFQAHEVEVIDNGVDVRHFRPQRDVERDPGNILFLGSLDWRPNQDAVRMLLDVIFPQVKRNQPRASLSIVGRNPPEWMKGRIASVAGASLHANVADVRPFLHSCGVMAVPLRIGGGSRLKILEALASATPVISTKIGAEGLNLRSDRHLTIVESEQEMIEALSQAIRDPDWHIGLADDGRRVVARTYDWEPLARKLGECWEAAEVEVATTPVPSEERDES